MDPKIRKLIDKLHEAKPDQLADIEAQLRAELDRLNTADLTDDVLADLETIANGITTVVDAQAALAQAEADRQARRDEILARVTPVAETPAPDGDGEGEDEGDGSDADEAPVTVETTAETPAPEPVIEAPVPVAAAGTRRPHISEINARRPAQKLSTKPAPGTPIRVPARLTAAADIAGIPSGAEFASRTELAQAFMRKHRAIAGTQGGSGDRFAVAQLSWEYPEDRRLSEDPGVNSERIAALLNPRSLVASGGLCAPVQPYYEQLVISAADRPVRDALASFQATRGGITFMPPLTLANLAGAVGVHTNQNDIDGTTKNVTTVACGTAQTVDVEAITDIIKFGNLGARTFPERVAAAIELARANWARTAERELLGAISTGSTAVTGGGGGLLDDLGATRAFLRHLDLQIASFHNFHRTPPEMPFTLLVPDWIDDMFRADLAAEQPGAADERLATADAIIDRMFAVRNLNAVRYLDGRTGAGQDFAAQGAGATLPWPSAIESYLFPAGTWLFGDGGTLDLGLVRDSTLNSTNDYEMFSESFEFAAKVGPESRRITVTVCPNGATAAAQEFDPCTVGGGS